MNEPPQWGKVPAPALTKIFTHLSQKDRLNASATCWHWRGEVFQPRFFKIINFTIERDNDEKNKFLLHHLSHLISETNIMYDSLNIYDIELVAEILSKLSTSQCLVRLTLRPRFAILATPRRRNSDEEYNYINMLFVRPIKALLQRRQLPFKLLDLGCSEALTLHADDLLKCSTRSQHLRILALASVKQDPSIYPLSVIEPTLFEKCNLLQILSIDYDSMNDQFLGIVQVLPLKKLIIHVHGLYEDHLGISEIAWFNFSNKKPFCEVHLSLIYAYEAVEVLHSHIFRPSMPLSHLKVLFCQFINMEALEYLPVYYKETLQSFIWIDSRNQNFAGNFMDLVVRTEQDPLVMMAWQCKRLHEIVIHGYVIDSYNLVGISRLRGRNLSRLEVSLYDMSCTAIVLSSFVEDISTALGRLWTPITNENLNSSLSYWPVSDNVRDKYILELVRRSLEY